MGFVCGLLMIQYSKSESDLVRQIRSYARQMNLFLLLVVVAVGRFENDLLRMVRSDAPSFPLFIHSIHLGIVHFETEMHSDHRLASRLGKLGENADDLFVRGHLRSF